MRYIISSKVGEEHILLGGLYDSPAKAKEAARDLNMLIPSLRVKVVDVPLGTLASQPPEIRQHVQRHLAQR